MPSYAVVRVIEHCCFNSTPDRFNDQTAKKFFKPPKATESRTYAKKDNLECYRNNNYLLLWYNWSSLGPHRKRNVHVAPLWNQVVIVEV